jgi:hypothetical protein
MSLDENKGLNELAVCGQSPKGVDDFVRFDGSASCRTEVDGNA